MGMLYVVWKIWGLELYYARINLHNVRHPDSASQSIISEDTRTPGHQDTRTPRRQSTKTPRQHDTRTSAGPANASRRPFRGSKGGTDVTCHMLIECPTDRVIVSSVLVILSIATQTTPSIWRQGPLSVAD
jgi:hypothetical protein